jgi:hypothetical protein
LNVRSIFQGQTCRRERWSPQWFDRGPERRFRRGLMALAAHVRVCGVGDDGRLLMAKVAESGDSIAPIQLFLRGAPAAAAAPAGREVDVREPLMRGPDRAEWVGRRITGSAYDDL